MQPKNEEFETQNKAISGKMSAIKNKILVMSGKGGVGKSTVAVNLACALSEAGHKVGLLDIDLHGPNVPRMLGIAAESMCVEDNEMLPYPVSENLFVCSLAMLGADSGTPIIWRGPRKTGAIRQMLGEVRWGELDYLLLDSPPGTGDEVLSAAQAVPEWTGAVVVVTPQEVALDDARRSIAFAGQVNLPVLGIVENMSGFVCPHCGKETEIFKKGGGEQLATDYGVEFLGRVPLEPCIVALADDGKPFCRKDRKTPAAKTFAEIADKLAKFCAAQAENKPVHKT
ncbi:MAG: Mrp/NBP35 family ATP-binding protein [Elusimicrobiaceae bacterium]|nr:Mrp/NBP35 family ATP-binding protein [Elusimicrobiaceae bacterium]